ncbi:ABC transporter ATP-binding protein [Sporosarcina limicola]|uniref:Oligopeptide transport system ATP-binding protein n=1 Tax=Sporosarcina limicola TaxID=34101 RepID=A0A927MGZ5_9BACL|nr:dipeptide ABC transporter ATP-binding protein [Sporosarcina limicola]MBE1552967.1 oligopeptide transport system ATP-binding protein [Sporosarcina limicola]
MNNENMLEVHNLKKYFNMGKKLFSKEPALLKAVDDVSFTIKKGETLGLVGESGCGKSTTARTIIRLHESTEGKIILDGVDISKLKESELKSHRKKMQMIFQDPYASLNSRMTVKDIISEPLLVHQIGSKHERMDIIENLLHKVGLKKEHATRYPHEFSGGQRQRIGIARALAVNPDFVICDEPISALDVSIQAQVVNMLQDLQEEMGLTYLFIAHDLSMVKYISNRMGVMYLGKLVEIADSEEVYKHPAHPYTKALLASVPFLDPQAAKPEEDILLDGDLPSPLNPPPGCRFASRCKYAMDICKKEEPLLKEIGTNHLAACHLL